MFLRWARYRNKQGRVRLYARLLSSRRVGKKVRHESLGSLYVRFDADVDWSADQRRTAWRHLDHVLQRYRVSPRERANIERAFAAEVGDRPPPTALENFIMAMARAQADEAARQASDDA
jgi:hypothetical protein